MVLDPGADLRKTAEALAADKGIRVAVVSWAPQQRTAAEADAVTKDSLEMAAVSADALRSPMASTAAKNVALFSPK